MTATGDVRVRVHDGDYGYFPLNKIFKMNTQPAKGDKVIAYWDDRAYAFGGKATDYNPTTKQWYIQFDDGDKGWIQQLWVHKRIDGTQYNLMDNIKIYC